MILLWILWPIVALHNAQELRVLVQKPTGNSEVRATCIDSVYMVGIAIEESRVYGFSMTDASIPLKATTTPTSSNPTYLRGLNFHQAANRILVSGVLRILAFQPDAAYSSFALMSEITNTNYHNIICVLTSTNYMIVGRFQGVAERRNVMDLALSPIGNSTNLGGTDHIESLKQRLFGSPFELCSRKIDGLIQNVDYTTMSVTYSFNCGINSKRLVQDPRSLDSVFIGRSTGRVSKMTVNRWKERGSDSAR